MKAVISAKSSARLVAFLSAGLLAFSLASVDVAAKDRGNKGGETRAKERATQVQDMNTEKKDEKGEAKSEKKSSKKDKKDK